VRSEAIRLVKGAFDRAGIVMPEPIYNVRLDRRPAGAPPGLAAADADADEESRMAAPVRAPPPGAARHEPAEAIDIARRDDLDRQIAADRSGNHEDLLRSSAAKE
jgi:hypothetical protein